MGHGAVGAILILLTIGLPLVLLTSRLKVGALAAYLLTGAIAGWLGQKWSFFSAVNHENLEPLAEVGASLLLFSLGLELDLPGMRQRLRQVVVSVTVQMGLTLVVGTLAVMSFGLPFAYAFAVGCCLTMSSTLLVLRALDERRLRNREEGKTVIGLLLAQDLCLAPLLAVLGLVLKSDRAANPWVMLLALVGCLVGTVFTRRVLASALLSRVRALSLPELEVAFAVIFALGAAWLTEAAGLGSAVGAFCAGLALGGDEHRHAVETSTRPLQGLMAIIFFSAMGVLFDPYYVRDHFLLVAVALMVSVAVKAALAAAALRIAGLSKRSAIGGGIMTAQMGEFSFVLAATAFGHASPTSALHGLYQLVVAVTVLSLAATPLLISLSVRFLPRSPIEDIDITGDTIVIAGLGPVGNTVVEALRDQGHPLLLVDRNRRLLAPWQETPGVRCHFGRIEDMDDWLPTIGHRPCLVVLTFPIADASALVTARLRAMDPELIIIARSPYEAQVEILRAAGAQFVICDERETTRALVPMLEEALAFRDRESTKTVRLERNQRAPL
jgi:monovalent cation:H+ antiporter-2, CPA2 family